MWALQNCSKVAQQPPATSFLGTVFISATAQATSCQSFISSGGVAKAVPANSRRLKMTHLLLFARNVAQLRKIFALVCNSGDRRRDTSLSVPPLTSDSRTPLSDRQASFSENGAESYQKHQALEDRFSGVFDRSLMAFSSLDSGNAETPVHPFLLLTRRTVARVRAHRFRGVVPVKVHAPKTEFYLQAEGQFLSERAQAPEGFVGKWVSHDLLKLSPELRRCLHLRSASNRQVHRWRKLQLRRRFQRRPFDTGSPAVKIACLTERILNLRAHLIRKPKDHSKKRTMSIILARRQKAMKYLYRTDFKLYSALCEQLRLKCVRFAIPDSRDRSRALNPLAIDGDRCKFLIRQKLWKGRYRPRPLKQPDGQTVRYTRHPIGQPPSDWSLPKEQNPTISRAWPYGVKEERIKGTYVVHNPTAPGLGYCPVPMLF